MTQALVVKKAKSNRERKSSALVIKELWKKKLTSRKDGTEQDEDTDSVVK